MGSSTNISNRQGKHGSVGKKIHRSNHNKAGSNIDGKEFIEHFQACNGIYSKTIEGRESELSENGPNLVLTSTEKEKFITQEKKMDGDMSVSQCDGSNIQESFQWFSGGKNKNGLKDGSSSWSRLSLQSLTELEMHDGFNGPFSWKTMSLLDMSFPHFNEEEGFENHSSTRHHKELSNQIYTVDALKEKLRRDYIEAQEQREKYRHMLSSGGSKCIQRTEESVEFITRNVGPSRSFQTSRNRFPLSALNSRIKDKSQYQYSPFKKTLSFEEPSCSHKIGIQENGISNNDDKSLNHEQLASSDSEPDEPEVRLTVKQISEDLDKVLFKPKSPGLSPTMPSTENVIDFLKSW